MIHFKSIIATEKIAYQSCNYLVSPLQQSNMTCDASLIKPLFLKIGFSKEHGKKEHQAPFHSGSKEIESPWIY